MDTEVLNYYYNDLREVETSLFTILSLCFTVKLYSKSLLIKILNFIYGEFLETNEMIKQKSRRLCNFINDIV